MSDYSPSDRVNASTAPAEKAGIWEDFVDIFYTPSSVFARRANGSVFIPILVITLLVGIISVFSLDAITAMIDAETRRAMAANPATAQIPPEQMEMIRRFQGITAIASAFIGTPVLILLVGLTLWLAGKIVDARQTVRAALVVAAYAWVPRVIESVLIGVQARLIDPTQIDGAYRLRLSPARFLDPDTASPIVIALLGRLDLFVIWVTVLLAIGLAVTGKVSRGRAAIAAVVVWIVGTLFPLFGALRAGG